jgi:hypothetical protein
MAQWFDHTLALEDPNFDPQAPEQLRKVSCNAPRVSRGAPLHPEDPTSTAQTSAASMLRATTLPHF